ncbi:MAG: DMT family transporter [Mobilitalea sp.]
MKQKQISSSFLLAFAALIWGTAFVAQSVGMEFVGPFTFNSVRFILGGIILIPVIYLFHRNDKINMDKEKATPKDRKILLIGGICCGCALAVGSSLQQFGILHTSVGKAGFITALYIVIVPIFGLFLKKKVRFMVWISVMIATIGMYLLSITEGFHIGIGDLFVFLCAIAFSVHILLIDYFSPLIDGIKLSCIQFFVAGILCGLPMLLFESPQLSSIVNAAVPILYTGIMSSGVAYTLQIVAQKNVNPVVASLIMSMESVFAALSGWIILGESLSTRELTGCTLVFVAIILAQIPGFRKGAGGV